jgi:hypothetical protein
MSLTLRQFYEACVVKNLWRCRSPVHIKLDDERRRLLPDLAFFERLRPDRRMTSRIGGFNPVDDDHPATSARRFQSQDIEAWPESDRNAGEFELHIDGPARDPTRRMPVLDFEDVELTSRSHRSQKAGVAPRRRAARTTIIRSRSLAQPVGQTARGKVIPSVSRQRWGQND